MRCWNDLRDDFRQAVAERGAASIAAAIPVHRATIYKLYVGQIERPHRATLQGIERILGRESNDDRNRTDN